jgi:hypothetical protein
MTNKEKNTKEEPHLLQDEENLGEIKKDTITTYDDKDQEDKPDDVSKAIQKAKPEDVSYNEDGTISVKESDVNEVEKSQVLKFDIKKSSDVKSLQQMLDKQGVEKGKMSIGTDGTISVSESLKQNKKILTVESFKKMVKDFNKINLSESEIMSILKKTQNPIMKKSELMETIEKKLISEANMEDSVIAQKIREKTGKENVTLDDVQRLMSSSLLAAAKEEYRLGIDRLEQKAVDMIRKKFKIPVGAVDFEATITGLPPQQLVGRRNISPQEAEALSRQIGAKVGTVDKGNIKSTSGNVELPQGKTADEMKVKIKRRRLTNAAMHGAARKSQNLHHLDDQLRRENPRLGQNYAGLMAANDASYFMMDDETIRREGESGIHAGNSRIDLSNPERPKVIAQGIVFPILLHELAKGVMELISLWGMADLSPEERKYVLDKTDNLASETNDIRLGAKIWEKFVRQIPMDNQEVISLAWTKLQDLDDREYNSVLEGLIENRTEAEMKVRRIAEEALAELQEEASDDEFGGYEDSPEQEDDGDVLTPPEDEGPGEPQPEAPESEEPNYENMSKRDLEIELDAAFDAGDMDLARHIGSILNSKR